MTPLSAGKALDAYFHDSRAKLLDLAAMLDRVNRGEGTGTVAVDPRMARIEQALQALLRGSGSDHAAEIQRIFSLDYDPAWKLPQPR